MNTWIQRIKNISRRPEASISVAIAKQIPIGLCVISKTETIEFINDVFMQLHGLKNSSVAVGARLSQIPVYQQKEISTLLHNALNGKPFDAQIHARSTNTMSGADERFYRLRGVPSSTSEKTQQVLLIAEDVSDRKRLETDIQEYIHKLQQEQARLLASIDSLEVGFLIIDVKNNILIKNQAIDRILELTDLEGQVLLKGDVEYIEERFGNTFDFKKNWEESLAEKKIVNMKEILFGAKYLKVFIAPIVMSQSDGAIGVVVLIEDITEAKILERSKDEFFSIASHELRTPLTAIRGNTSVITEYFGEQLKDPQLKELISDIHEASVRLIGIVNDFLDLSRLEQKKIEFKIEPFDLVLAIQEVIKEIESMAAEKKLYLRLDPPAATLPMANGDKNRAKQVIINVIANALKFTESGGVSVSVRADGKNLQVTVTDTGRGIPLENQSLLFHKFQQAGDSLLTRDTTKGTGLGLYIGKLITEGMGGKIWLVKSEPEKGTVFAFTIPQVERVIS